MKESRKIIIRPSSLQAILDDFSAAKRAQIAALLTLLIEEANRELQILDLWDESELAVSFWILMMTDTDQEDEMKIAKDMLAWKAFSARDSSRVLCVPSSQRVAFRCCSNHFDTKNYPTLFFSDDPAMTNFIQIGPELLYRLSGNKGGIQRLLTQIHSSVEIGADLEIIKRQLLSKRFWVGLKVVYEEAKSLISFNIKSEI